MSTVDVTICTKSQFDPRIHAHTHIVLSEREKNLRRFALQSDVSGKKKRIHFTYIFNGFVKIHRAGDIEQRINMMR